MRVFSLVMLIVGGFIGAGFASGREVASYFSRFGSYSNLAILVAMIVLGILIYLFLFLSSKFENFSCFINYYFAKFGGVVNFFFGVSFLILISSMFAGCAEVASVLKINQILVIFITAFFAFFICLGNINRMTNLSKILVPIMLAVIVYVSIGKIANFSTKNNVILSIISGVDYVFINIVSLGLFVLNVGKNYTNKQKIVASISVSAVVGIVLLVFNNAIITHGLEYSVMPILQLCLVKGKGMYFLTIISIWLALFTTLISNVYLLSLYTNKFIKNKHINLIIILCASMLISGFGFEVIINYIYSIIGVVGMVLILRVLLHKKRRLKIFNRP